MRRYNLGIKPRSGSLYKKYRTHTPTYVPQDVQRIGTIANLLILNAFTATSSILNTWAMGEAPNDQRYANAVYAILQMLSFTVPTIVGYPWDFIV